MEGRSFVHASVIFILGIAILFLAAGPWLAADTVTTPDAQAAAAPTIVAVATGEVTMTPTATVAPGVTVTPTRTPANTAPTATPTAAATATPAATWISVPIDPVMKNVP